MGGIASTYIWRRIAIWSPLRPSKEAVWRVSAELCPCCRAQRGGRGRRPRLHGGGPGNQYAPVAALAERGDAVNDRVHGGGLSFDRGNAVAAARRPHWLAECGELRQVSRLLRRRFSALPRHNSRRQTGEVSMTSKTQPTVALNDGAAMPQFGLGVFQTPPDETERVVKMAVDEGYRLVDTASMYRNEDGVGRALLGRTDVFVTTKLGNSDHGFDEALRAFDESARKLRRDTLDLYLIHWPRPRINRYVESWKAFVRLQKDGRVRSIGVSNFNRDHLERIIGETGVTPAANQVELHPRFQQKALRAFHDQHGIKTESWSPLGRGGLVGDPALVDIAAKHRKTPAQVVIRWHLDSSLISIPKTVRFERLKENIGALDFKLDGDDMKRIEALDLPSGRIGPDPATATF